MTELITHLDEIEKPVPELIAQFGACRSYKAPNGTTITVLPTADLQLANLVEGNWDTSQSIERGHFRSVVEVKKLIDGSPAEIFVKSPERTFSGSNPDRLWWGGPRSGEKLFRLEDPLVEEQVEWETAILITLVRNQVRAETPQAILENKGVKRLIVRAIPSTIGSQICKGPSQISIQTRIRELGLRDVDFTFSANAFSDNEGYTHVIDVNRWDWPGQIDRFRVSLRTKLIQAISQRRIF